MSGGVLVTGGAGFIGSALVRRLLERTAEAVAVYDRLTYAGHRVNLEEVSANPRYRFVEGDICDGAGVASLLKSTSPSVVYHLAAESHVDQSISNPDRFIETNVLGTYTLLQQSLNYWRGLQEKDAQGFRFIHVSTDEVYGSLGREGKFSEASPFDPSSPYAATKASADHLVRAWHKTFGLPTICTHSSNNYGPRQFPEKLIPLVVHNALSGKPLPIYGNGKNIRDWIFVEDHANALITVATSGKPGERYNIGADCEYSNIAIVESVCGLLDELAPDSPHRPHANLIRFVTDRPGHDLRYATDASKISDELGWLPETGFEAGLRTTVKWYIENNDWRQTVLRARSNDPVRALNRLDSAAPNAKRANRSDG